MQTIKIKELPAVNNLTNNDVIPLSQEGVTKKTNLDTLRKYIAEADGEDYNELVGAINELRTNLNMHNVDNSAHENIQQSITNETNERKNADSNLQRAIDNINNERYSQGIYQQRDQSTPLTVSGVIIGGDDPLNGEHLNVSKGSFIVPPEKELNVNDFVFITYRHDTEGDILCIAKITAMGPISLGTCTFKILSRADGLTAGR